MRRLGPVIASLLAGCATPAPVPTIQWHKVPSVVPAEYYVWHVEDDIKNTRKIFWK